MKKQCPNCHKPITEKRGDAKFCSRECQNAYAYKLRKGQVKGLGGLSDLKIVKPDVPPDDEDLSEVTEPYTEPETENIPQVLPPYKTPTVDSDSMKDFLGDTDFEQGLQDQEDDEYDEDDRNETESETEQENKPLPEKYINKQVQTDNPLFAQNEMYLKDQQQLKQKLEQEYLRLEAELKFQEGRTGNDLVATGAVAGGIIGWESIPIKSTKKTKSEKKDDIVLKDKNGKSIFRSIENKWEKIKSKKKKKKEKKATPPETNEPSILQRLGGLLLFGAIGASLGYVAKTVTEDFRKKDKKEKIEAIKKRMEEVRRDYAIVTYNISGTQKTLGQMSRYLLSDKTVVNPDYEKALNGINNKTEQGMSKKQIKKSTEPARFKSDKVIRATDLANQKFSALDFKGVWREFFGLPSTNFHILIHGNSGEGKSTFCLWFAKYLAENFGVVLYVSGEEGTNKTFHDKLKYCSANVKDLHILDVRTGDEFMHEINENEAHFIFLDSLHDMDIDAEKLKQIFQKYKNSAFICIDQNNKKGDLLGANEKKHICDVVVNVRNYTAETTKSRFKSKGVVFKTEDFPGSEKRNLTIKSIRKEDKGNNGYNLDSDRRGIV